MNSNQRGFRGVQIHAVPDAEKAMDGSGKRLPWGYDTTLPSSQLEGDQRQPVEKGPFGRSMRRSRSGASRSRSKTVEPRREEDRIRTEQLAAEDAVFGSLRKTGKDDGRGQREALGEVDPNAVAQQTPPVSSKTAGEIAQEATEVMLYGFGADTQWAAIDFYERVSQGSLLEDYERGPPGPRYDISRSYGRGAVQRSLSKAALRKKNRYAGGQHWIKVTFESRQAAELACARSPHIIKGHLVYAEPWMGRGPGRDEPIFASQAGAQITSATLPPSFSTNTLNFSPNSSSTLTSATATAASGDRAVRRSTPVEQVSSASSTATLPAVQVAATTSPREIQGSNSQQLQTLHRGRIEGAKQAVLLPAELALMPRQARPSWTAWMGGSELIGTTVPRAEDGKFDWNKASLYWRLWASVDGALGTDFCGLREE